ncbi:polysaccharide biosynthesis/export family protein [Acinetobacter rudis]|uniref:Polysaccharide biosynthesis/export family protein n=1 Tax=Acinetobacter rudis TaxID=632955 RepID=A0AAW8JCT4_9GAMM|nr:polysaccharide biosynthesis/export family protein [Acinetobacter rudis]MDQ8937004.1 polysaccharide biosynthesis/export family protein [Acinetobacter rudis]MDQ9019209.1 polysaccharide biosynthesis/export family protein [Acinetobacter rudis]
MNKKILCSALALLSYSSTMLYANSMLPNNPILAGLDVNQQAREQDPTILPSQSISPNSNATVKYPSNSNMFGSQLFKGAFSATAGSTFNNSYKLNPGDQVNVRMWGAYQYAGTQTVDPKGNLFLPNIGPVQVQGVSNGQLQALIESHVRKVYVSNVGVYASLVEAQPVKVLVTGVVNQPGNYGGLANDSVVAYLDRAGGVDPERGSYIDIKIMRNGQIMQQVDLYEFLISGRLQPFSFRDGDVVVVGPRTQTFSISGEVFNAYDFEFNVPYLSVAQALSVAKAKPGATNISIMRRQGNEYRSEYYPISQANDIQVQNGDVLSVTADRYAGTIQVRIEGANNGEHAIVLPYGAKLSEVLPKIKPNTLANMQALQLFRPSVAKRQKEMLNIALDKLEDATFNARSSTQEEAKLRSTDAELVKQFVAKARQTQPLGQVVLNPNTYQDVILEQGDILKIPEITSVVMVHGEVAFANGVEYQPNRSAISYIEQVGGFSQKSNKSKVIVIHQNGEAELVSKSSKIQQGDEIMVLPKASSKSIEVARGITAILYQIAIMTKVALDL